LFHGDDFDGGQADETITLGLDGKIREIDQSGVKG
jgi:hypothetical protein